MIGYTTLGASDHERANAFYAPIAEELGARRMPVSEHLTLWGDPRRGGMLGIITPNNREPPTVGNGVMVALKATGVAAVQAAHAAALAAGGADEGPPGPRPADSTSFYGAYFRDPTGNKLCVFTSPSA